jgi:hypothetical protein
MSIAVEKKRILTADRLSEWILPLIRGKSKAYFTPSGDDA